MVFPTTDIFPSFACARKRGGEGREKKSHRQPNHSNQFDKSRVPNYSRMAHREQVSPTKTYTTPIVAAVAHYLSKWNLTGLTETRVKMSDNTVAPVLNGVYNGELNVTALEAGICQAVQLCKPTIVVKPLDEAGFTIAVCMSTPGT